MSFAGGMAGFGGGSIGGPPLAEASARPMRWRSTASPPARTSEEQGRAWLATLSAEEAVDVRARSPRPEPWPGLARRGLRSISRAVPLPDGARAAWTTTHLVHPLLSRRPGTGAVNWRSRDETRAWSGSVPATPRPSRRGELSIIFPTRRNLERLAQFASFAEAKAHAEAHEVRMIVPEIAQRDGREALTIPEDRGYPVTHEWLDRAMRG